MELEPYEQNRVLLDPVPGPVDSLSTRLACPPRQYPVIPEKLMAMRPTGGVWCGRREDGIPARVCGASSSDVPSGDSLT